MLRAGTNRLKSSRRKYVNSFKYGYFSETGMLLTEYSILYQLLEAAEEGRKEDVLSLNRTYNRSYAPTKSLNKKSELEWLCDQLKESCLLTARLLESEKEALVKDARKKLRTVLLRGMLDATERGENGILNYLNKTYDDAFPQDTLNNELSEQDLQYDLFRQSCIAALGVLATEQERFIEDARARYKQFTCTNGQ